MTADAKTPGSGIPDDRIRADVPHSARIYNYWLGGKDCFDIDRMVGDQVIEAEPDIRTQALHNRAFLARAVTYMVRECGIRQFLDIGTGLPSANNTHQVAQQLAPECRIVYVDNDPVVLAHARALLTSSPQGASDYLDVDMREPRKILAAAAKTLDFGEPVGVMMLGIIHHLTEDGDARAVIETIMDGVHPGSHLAISVNTNVIEPERMDRAAAAYNEAFGNPPIQMYTPERLAAQFAGLELVEPGVVSVARWRPDPADAEAPEMDTFVGVARKP